MTEGGAPAATEPFATSEDVVNRWRAFRDDDEEAVATERLADASALLRLTATRLGVTDFVARVQAEPDLARVTKSIVVEVVRRYLRNPDGAKQLQNTIGPRSYGLTFDGEKPSGIFFTEEELKELLPTAASDDAGGYIFGTMPIGFGSGGWSPYRRRTPGASGWYPG